MATATTSSFLARFARPAGPRTPVRDLLGGIVLLSAAVLLWIGFALAVTAPVGADPEPARAAVAERV
jgi:hypothetical protein